MTMEIGVVFAILGTAILLFITDWIRADIVAALLLISLATTGYTLVMGQRLLPGENEKGAVESREDRTDLMRTYHLADRLWEVLLLNDSSWVGKTLQEIAELLPPCAGKRMGATSRNNGLMDYRGQA